MDHIVLAIDFGSTSTLASLRVGDHEPEVLEIDGYRFVPSMVFIDDDGAVLVGRVAESLAAGAPERVLRSPKRRLADPSPVVIGGRSFDTTHLVAGLLRYVLGEAERFLGRSPDEIRLTHPATWGRPQLRRLQEAASLAGITNPTLIPEPVAAALAYALAADTKLSPGSYVAVYDLGGGTFDTALLQATDEGFQIVGRPTGDPNLGGELFDELIAEHLAERLDPTSREALLVSDEAIWRRAAARLRGEARRAKEAVSLHPHADVQLSTPGGSVQTRLTRDDVHTLVDPYLEESIDRLARLVADEGIQAFELSAVYLTGGATRMLRVAELLTGAFAPVPIVRRGDPKAAVALGALHDAVRSSATAIGASTAPALGVATDATAGSAGKPTRPGGVAAGTDVPVAERTGAAGAASTAAAGGATAAAGRETAAAPVTPVAPLGTVPDGPVTNPQRWGDATTGSTTADGTAPNLPPGGLPPAGPPTGPGATAADGPAPSGPAPLTNERRRRSLVPLLVALIALVLGAAGLTAATRRSGTEQFAIGPGEVFLEPAAAAGPDPFTPTTTAPTPNLEGATPTKPADGSADAQNAPSNDNDADGNNANGENTSSTAATLTVSGDTPGLFGGTRNQSSCDAAKLVRFLETSADKAIAWAAVQGIAATDTEGYVATLTPVLLRTDTRVTNHGFAEGKATPRQAVLQAGTAVLVDPTGVPRVRCACGNPLVGPAAVEGAAVRFVGKGWPAFRPQSLRRIVPAATDVEAFSLVDPGGAEFERPVGSTGAADALATTTTASPASTTAAPPVTAAAVDLGEVETAPIEDTSTIEDTSPPSSASAATTSPPTEPPTTVPATTLPAPTLPATSASTAPLTTLPSATSASTQPATTQPRPTPPVATTATTPPTPARPVTTRPTTRPSPPPATSTTVAPVTTRATKALPVIAPIAVPPLSGGIGTREFFTDTFADPLDYANEEDVALLNEGPIQGNASVPTMSGGQMTLILEQPGYFSPLWGGYDTGANERGSEAIGHDREGNIHPVDPGRYPTFRVRMNVSAAVGGGIFFYTCPAGVNDRCQSGVQFVTEPGWKVYEAPLPQGRAVTGIRVAVSPDGVPVTIVVDWAGVYGSGPGNTDGNGGVGGPVPELLNPDVAGAVPYLFPFGGRPVPYVGRVCANNDWGTLNGDAWDMDKAADVEKVDNYPSWSITGGFFDGTTGGAPNGGQPGDPGVRLALRRKTIDPRIWHRNTLIVPTWEGRYSQQFRDDGGWVYRVLWKFVGNDRFQISAPLAEYPNDTTLSVDMNDPNPFDGSPPPALNVNEPRLPGQIGWSTPGLKVTTFRHDVTEPYKPKRTRLDEVMLSTDDCASSDVDIVYRDNNVGGPTTYEFFKSASPIGPWETIGQVDAALSQPSIWTWQGAPKGRWWIKVVASRGGAVGEHVSTGPVSVGNGLDTLG